MQNYNVDFLKKIVDSYSPSSSEQSVAEIIRDEMTSLGFHTRTDQAGNVIGEIGTSGPRILFCGHMDTVPGFVPARQEGNLLYGRGTVDAKSSLAAMILGSALAIHRRDAQFRATVAALVQEETSSLGIKTLSASTTKYDMAVFGEPSNTSNIIIGYKGSLRLEANFVTKGGHSSSPWISRNSVEEAVRFWNKLQESLIKNDGESKFSTITGCVTRIEGGNGTNTIPVDTSIQVDIRIPPGTSPAEVAARIELVTNMFREEHNDVKILTAIRDSTMPYLGDSDSPAVRAFRNAIRKVTGSNVELLKKTGTSDMNTYAQSSKIPMVAYGPGNSSLDHTDQECIDVNDYLKSIEIYSRAIARFASVQETREKTALVNG